MSVMWTMGYMLNPNYKNTGKLLAKYHPTISALQTASCPSLLQQAARARPCVAQHLLHSKLVMFCGLLATVVLCLQQSC